MKSKFAIAAASALMLIAAPSAFADDSRPADTGGGSGDPVENPYPALPSECQPTADRTAIECTYDYGDRIDVQPAFGCWTLDDGSTLCVDPPEIVPVPGCNYAAGECEIVFDPATDKCVIERGTSATVWIGRAGQFYVIDWPWGENPDLDAALIRNGAEFRDAIATGNIDFVISACDPGAGWQTSPDEPGPLPPEEPLPLPAPGDITGGGTFDDSPIALNGARAEKGGKQKKAKKKSRGKKSKQQKSRR